MSPELVRPPKLQPGDRVAVVSPSFAAPALFPAVHELAMTRLRAEFGLTPVEYPTTRELGASPADRARDLMAAFADPSIRAVLATVGGDDQITVTPYLDAAVVRADPKPFFGYSDNTNLLDWLWRNGLAAYHGGSTQVHLGRGGALHPTSTRSLRAALFESGDVELEPAADFGEDDVRWDDPAHDTTHPPMSPGAGWTWHGPSRRVSGPTWGGNLEILHWLAAADRVRPVAEYAGCVLLLETSEEQPPAEEVFRMLRNLGERGLLEQFPAVLVGRTRATDGDRPREPADRSRFRTEQQVAVVRAFAAYHPTAVLVFDVDFGHTDPQWVLPYGAAMIVDSTEHRIVARY